jgi:hypothetical protein
METLREWSNAVLISGQLAETNYSKNQLQEEFLKFRVKNFIKM